MQDEMQTIQKILGIVIDFFVNYSFQVVGAILVFIIGVLVARFVSSFLLKFFEKKEFDITLSKFIVATVKGIILGFAVIMEVTDLWSAVYRTEGLILPEKVPVGPQCIDFVVV